MDEIISSYSRAQAIQDGVLIDTSTLAREAGFRIPVAITQAAWAECIAVSCEDIGQDETGRLWDVLNVLWYELRRASWESVLFFDVLVSKGGQRPRPVSLKVHYGPGDQGEAVLTVMLPDED